MAARWIKLGVIAALVVVGGWGGYMWFRDLSLFRVHHVTITGLDRHQTPAIRRALRETAMRMSTLHVREDELKQAVDAFPVVRSVSASADFPSGLKIRVEEWVPVAALVSSDGRRVAVSAANTLLRSVGPTARLPTVKVTSISTSGNLDDPTARRLVAALAEAPPELRPLVDRAYETSGGIRIPLRKGPALYFGRAERLAAKWAAATRVLADSAAKGARLIDVRLPERPAAVGFAPGQGSTGQGGGAAEADANTQL